MFQIVNIKAGNKNQFFKIESIRPVDIEKGFNNKNILDIEKVFRSSRHGYKFCSITGEFIRRVCKHTGRTIHANRKLLKRERSIIYAKNTKQKFAGFPKFLGV